MVDEAHPITDPEHDRRDASATTLGSVVADAGDRVQEILDTAERVAGNIQADAETAAERYLEERRAEADGLVEQRIDELAVVSRAVKARIETLQQEAAALIAELETTISRMVRVSPEEGRLGVTPRPTEAPQGWPSLQPVAYAGKGAPAAPAPPTPAAGPTPTQAILRATQMAVAGSNRSDIEHMLRDEFGVQNPATVVDGMLRSDPA